MKAPTARSPLIRSNTVAEEIKAENIASCSQIYVIILLMLYCTLFCIGMYAWMRGVAPLADLPKSAENSSTMKELNREVGSVLMYLHMVPATLGFVLSAITLGNIIKTHLYGISLVSDMLTSTLILIFNVLLFIQYIYVAAHIRSFREDNQNFVSPFVNSYVAFIEHGFDNSTDWMHAQESKMMLFQIHKQFRCCGFNGFEDFHQQNKISFVDKPRESFALSWRDNGTCSGNNTCVPTLCCKRQTKDCNKMTKAHAESTTIWTTSCRDRIVGYTLTPVILVIINSVCSSVVAIVFLFHLIYWMIFKKKTIELLKVC